MALQFIWNSYPPLIKNNSQFIDNIGNFLGYLGINIHSAIILRAISVRIYSILSHQREINIFLLKFIIKVKVAKNKEKVSVNVKNQNDVLLIIIVHTFQLIKTSLYYILQRISKEYKSPSLNAKSSQGQHRIPKSIFLNKLVSLFLITYTKVSY